MNDGRRINMVDMKVLMEEFLNQREDCEKQIGIFLSKNREVSEDIISILAEFIHINTKSISDRSVIKVIENILKIMEENNIQISNFIKLFFPLLINKILLCDRTISEFELITKTIGKITLKCGGNAGPIIEANIVLIFSKINNQEISNDYAKKALLSLLKKFIKNSPVISYNKIIETFDEFEGVIEYYRYSKDYIREAVAEVIANFLLLLNNRDLKIREQYTKRIYLFIEKIIVSETLTVNSSNINDIHGTLLMIKTITIRREFFNEKYLTVMRFLDRIKEVKWPLIQISVIQLLPSLGEYLRDEFQKLYFGKFYNYLITLCSNSKPNIKDAIYISLGKLSIIITKEVFGLVIHKLIALIKKDFDDSTCLISQAQLECLTNLLKNYQINVLSVITLDVLFNKIFSSGLYEHHVKFLRQLLMVYEENSPQEIQILLLVLNVISIIITSHNFCLDDTKQKLKSLSTNQSQGQGQGTTGLRNVNMNSKSTNNYSNKNHISKSIPASTNSNILKIVKVSISNYIITQKKLKSEEEYQYLIIVLARNSLLFLKTISHPFFAKDILTFYFNYCMKELIDDNSLKIKEVISLANAPWMKSQPSDKDTEYMLRAILDSYLNLILISKNDDLKLFLLNHFDNRYDVFLSEDDSFRKLLLVLDQDDNYLKEQIVIILSRLILHNYRPVISFVKKQMLEIFMTLEKCNYISKKEDSIVLLSFFIKYLGQYLSDYFEIVFSSLIRSLRNEKEIETNATMNQIKYNNEMLTINILSIVSELISDSYSKTQSEVYYKDILLICIENLKENWGSFYQEVSLKTILAIFEHSDIEWNIYFEFIDLVNLLIHILQCSNNKNTRLYALKIFGFIGAMDPDKKKVLWNIHNEDNITNTEDYDDDEFDNYDDEELLNHNKKQVIKNRKGVSIVKVRRDDIDFDQLINDKELDSCTYHTVSSILNILNDNSQSETSTQVINIFGNVLLYFQQQEESNNSIIDLILPKLIQVINNFEGISQRHLFKHISFIIKNFEGKCSGYIRDLVTLVESFIEGSDYQGIIFEILMKLLELYLEDMETYFSRLVPLLLGLLYTSEEYSSRVVYIRKKVFDCFCLMSSKLTNYIVIIIPEMITILEKSILIIQNIAVASGKKLDEDKVVFEFIMRIIPLSSFPSEMTKVINLLLKYLSVSQESFNHIMNIFMLMLKQFPNDFVGFLPWVIRSAKEKNDSDLINYFDKIRSELHMNSDMQLLEMINNNINNAFEEQYMIYKKTKERKKTVDSSRSSYNDSISISPNPQTLLHIQKFLNEKNKNNIDDLLNEFNPINCSIKEDWDEWFKSSSKILFHQSPLYVLYCCENISEYLTDLYNYAFISVWNILTEYQRTKMISYLNDVLCSPTTPNSILMIILNLSEFIERENNIEFIDYGKLATVAGECKAYAKALYYTENDFRNNKNINSLEYIINLDYELNLPESAIGILKMAQKHNKQIKEDDLYLKLHQWKEALDVINKKKKTTPLNQELIKGNFICLDGLCDWESMLKLGDEVEDKCTDVITQMAPSLAKASLNLRKWDKLQYYVNKIHPEDDEEEYEKNFFQAVLSIKDSEYDTAKKSIEKARDAIDNKIKTLLSESYERAYKVLVLNEHLYELEEIITLNENQNKNTYTLTKDSLKRKWDERLENVSEDPKVYERILAIRALIFPIDEDYDKHLDLAKICREDDHFATCMIILERLRRPLEQNKNITISIAMSLNKCLYENTQSADTEKAIKNLEAIIKNEVESVDNVLKSKVFCLYAFLNLEKNIKGLSEPIVNNITTYLQLSMQYNNKNYKAWHYYGLLNYKFLELMIGKDFPQEQKAKYAINAISGFIESVCIGGKVMSKTLQDLLRLIDVWFQMGDDDTVIQLMTKSFDIIAIDSWLLVIPQLIARVNMNNEKIRNMLITILKKIGLSHPRAIIYPLIVLYKTKNKLRKETAGAILKEMNKKHAKLISECEMIIDELNRCALLLHEKWTEAIEESAKLYFESNDINGMIKTLMEVHDRMEETPTTINEIHFHQMYRSKLLEAKDLLNDFLEYRNELDIRQAWTLYHEIFSSIKDNFHQLKSIDLKSVSPSLAKFKQSEICIPGMYRSDYPVVKIGGFAHQLIVLNSKQHPSKITIYGSDGKDYMFLLKGHEDLRQDERAMQLFGLVNTLLSLDADTQDKNLFIKRFPVIALSNNTGILGWVPNCDTLSQLIKEYRVSNEICPNIEHRLMSTFFREFESASFLTKLEVFKYSLDNTLGLDVNKILWKKSKNCEAWLDRRKNFSRSLAVMSMVGYILGLGDRHPSNLMLDRRTGKIFHIDFGDCFEVAMKREKYPERVPFRLTRMMIKALEVSGIEGTFRITCENVMRVLRANKDSLIAILTAFVHDPLISFRILIPMILKANKTNRAFAHHYKNSNRESNKTISESLKECRPEELPRHNNTMKQKAFTLNTREDIEDLRYDKRRMGSVERQLYYEFEERDEIETDELNRIGRLVLERIIDKLQGTDFSQYEILDFKQQVEKLIKQATSPENLSQSYLGWCPFW